MLMPSRGGQPERRRSRERRGRSQALTTTVIPFEVPHLNFIAKDLIWNTRADNDGKRAQFKPLDRETPHVLPPLVQDADTVSKLDLHAMNMPYVGT
jgi:hypothetical protein